MWKEFSGSSRKLRFVFLRSRRPAAHICEICLDKVGTMVGEKRRESETDGGRLRRSRRDVTRKQNLKNAEELVVSIFFKLCFWHRQKGRLGCGFVFQLSLYEVLFS